MGAQDGFTLIEILVAMTMGLVVLGSAFGFYLVSLDSQDAAGQRSELTSAVRVAMNRMDGEIRDAASAGIANSLGGPAQSAGPVIDLETPVLPSGGGAKTIARVVYDCSVAGAGGTHTCTRDQGPQGGALSGTPAEVLKNVTNTSVFSVGSGTAAIPSFVNITLTASFKSINNGDPSQRVQLQDGVQLRNIQVP